MNDTRKRLLKFLNNPASLRYKEIERTLISFKFQKIPAKGSHVKFKHPDIPYDLIIPVHNNDCKDFYKKLASNMVKKINDEKFKN